LVVTDTTVLLRGYNSNPGNYVVFYLTPYIPLSFDKERGKNFQRGALPLFDFP
jgi:hypothetical protein